MARFAVAYMNFFDNELVVEIVEADDWRGAIFKHSTLSNIGLGEWLDNMPHDKIDTQNYFFDADSSIDVVEIIDPNPYDYVPDEEFG
jgi:hypothetical protein